VSLHYSYILISLVINDNTRQKPLPLEVTGMRKGITYAFDAVIVLSRLKPTRRIKKHCLCNWGC